MSIAEALTASIFRFYALAMAVVLFIFAIGCEVLQDRGKPGMYDQIMSELMVVASGLAILLLWCWTQIEIR